MSMVQRSAAIFPIYRDQAEKQTEWEDAHRKPPRVLGAELDG
jgi:hypothetical protein